MCTIWGLGVAGCTVTEERGIKRGEVAEPAPKPPSHPQALDRPKQLSVPQGLWGDSIPCQSTATRTSIPPRPTRAAADNRGPCSLGGYRGLLDESRVMEQESWLDDAKPISIPHRRWPSHLAGLEVKSGRAYDALPRWRVGGVTQGHALSGGAGRVAMHDTLYTDHRTSSLELCDKVAGRGILANRLLLAKGSRDSFSWSSTKTRYCSPPSVLCPLLGTRWPCVLNAIFIALLRNNPHRIYPINSV